MKDIQLSEIKGISLFTFKEEGLLHRFYIANGQNITEDKRFTIHTDYFYTAEMNLMGNAIFKDPYIKWTMFAIPTPANARLSANSFTTKNKTNRLSNAIIDVSGIQLEGEALLDGCGSCGGGPGNCTQDSQGSYCCESCAPPICESQAINSIIGSTGLTLDLKIAYSFRDNFLKKSDVGRKYTSYYYLIGKVAVENNAITRDNVKDYFDLATKVYDCAKIIQFGNDNDIVCDEKFQAQALALIEKYRALSSDKAYQEALSIIESDLYKFTDKTKAYVLANWE